MKLEDFSNPAGQIIKTLEGHRAFLPNPLPPSINIVALLTPIGESIQLLGELKGAARRTENPYILIEPLQRREALTTSAMEGTHTSIESLVLEEEGLATSKNEDVKETLNYIRALRLAIRSLEKYPISHRIICGAHSSLLSGLSNERGTNKRSGEYKKFQNWIGNSKDINQARYVPPPPDQTQTCMNDLEKYINLEGRNIIQKVLDLGIVHYQFEAIHPFGDGNGRIGRMLITLMAQQSGLSDLPLLYLSPYLENKKDEYIDLMYAVTTRSAWTEWLLFFLNAINATSKDTIHKIDDLLALQKKYKRLAAESGRSAKLLETIDGLFRSPYTTIPRTMEKHDITYRAAQLLLGKLVNAGILKEISATFPKQFVAQEIVQISNRN